MSGLRHQFARVVRFDAAAVLNANLVGGRFVGNFAERLANERMRFLRLLRRGVSTGADRPNRFVGDHRFAKFFRAQFGQASAQLNC